MYNVLMAGPLADSGGVAVHTKYLTKFLLKNEVNIISFDFHQNKLLLPLASKIYQRTVGLFILAFQKRDEYDIIHTQTSGGIPSFISAVTGSLIAIFLNKKLIVTFHNSSNINKLSTRYHFLFSFVLKNTDRMILVSNKQKFLLSKYFPIYSSKMFVIPNGYDSSLFFAQDANISRKKLGLPIENKVIVSVGNLLEVKGHKHLIESMKEIVKHRKDVQCYVVGSGRLENKLREQIISSGLQECVILVGARPHDDIPLWINACDLFVLPSLNEGNPTVMFECLGCGKPFVGTKVGGVPEIISSDDYGLLVESGDTQDLAEKIKIVLDKEWDGEKIMEYSSKFTWEEISKQVVEVYSEINQSNQIKSM
ncbi:glycosyltransferase [Methanococcoides sp. SA1]|nr:glycosyltransferase [Methanococcoides sp. SA1]